MRGLPLLAALLFTAAPPSFAGFTRAAAGTSGANFLKLGVGARATAMGGAYSAVADDPTALYWNPAGLAALSYPEFESMYASHVGEVRYQHFALGAPVPKFGGGAAFDVLNMTLGTLTETDASGTELGSFSPRNLAVAAGYARAFGPLRLGGAARFISSRLLKSASTLAVDAGAQYALDESFTLGAALQNLGPGLTFEAERDPLPTTLRLGTAYAFAGKNVIAADVELPRDNAPVFRLGGERLFVEAKELSFRGRAGFNTRPLTVEGFAGPSFGFGVGWRDLKFDYAFAAFGELGFTHRVGLGYRFSE